MLTPTLEGNVTRFQAERDAMLDRIAYLEDTRKRTGSFLLALSTDAHHPITPFDMGEALQLLWESQADSEHRRFGHLLQSKLEQEEETA